MFDRGNGSQSPPRHARECRLPERLETLLILPGTDFDDEFMDNDYTQENGSDDEDNEVVCTSNIGLESVTRDGISGIVRSKVTVLEQMEL